MIFLFAFFEETTVVHDVSIVNFKHPQLFRPLDALILPLAGRRWLLGKLALKLGVP